jgi:hypothetical protein
MKSAWRVSHKQIGEQMPALSLDLDFSGRYMLHGNTNAARTPHLW